MYSVMRVCPYLLLSNHRDVDKLHISYFDWHNTGASEVVEWRREQQQWQRPLP